MTMNDDQFIEEARRELSRGPRAESGSCWHPVDAAAEAAEGVTPATVTAWAVWGDFAIWPWMGVGVRRGPDVEFVTRLHPADAVDVALRIWAAADLGDPFAWWLTGRTLADIHAVFDDVRDRRWFPLAHIDPEDTSKHPREVLVYRDEGRGMVVLEVRGRRTEHFARTGQTTFHLPMRAPLLGAALAAAVRGGRSASPDRSPGWFPLSASIVHGRSPEAAASRRTHRYDSNDVRRLGGADVIYRGRAAWITDTPVPPARIMPMSAETFCLHHTRRTLLAEDADRVDRWWRELDDDTRRRERRGRWFAGADRVMTGMRGYGIGATPGAVPGVAQSAEVAR